MYLAPQNIPHAVVLTFGNNKVILYCIDDDDDDDDDDDEKSGDVKSHRFYVYVFIHDQAYSRSGLCD